ncbi:hypothetical protein JHL17_19355 [Azospirillum sp. YIM B02556]|uniref:DUF7079 domain-containing protein n=1 Tax=Azospirillum endophyticum TaxID=2800326 RepID=A0ABS1F812_9PROT|nr:hypothetical protein [Azospirillum endophyticum]MBK1839571.1 hypothetical protein [Azospirillum endophyticum]
MNDDIRFSQSELEDRRPVWDALSSMYLDTDVSSSRDWRVRVLAASRYSLDQMDSILRDEVHPICLPNLLHPTGEWAGFDPAWLEQAICSHRNRRLSRLLTTIGRTLMDGFPTDEWTATRRGIVSRRGQYRPPGGAR